MLLTSLYVSWRYSLLQSNKRHQAIVPFEVFGMSCLFLKSQSNDDMTTTATIQACHRELTLPSLSRERRNTKEEEQFFKLCAMSPISFLKPFQEILVFNQSYQDLLVCRCAIPMNSNDKPSDKRFAKP
jgi:hypothetical protein